MDRVNFVTYGYGYCDVCGRDENLLLIGDSEWKGICKSCLPNVIDAMKNIGSLIQLKQPRQDDESSV